jgi:hypothetical protein
MGRQFQFGRSNCGRTACIGCRPAPQDRERLLWRMGPFERPSAYGGLYFETGHWHGDFLADRMTGSGRLPVPVNGRFRAVQFRGGSLASREHSLTFSRRHRDWPARKRPMMGTGRRSEPAGNQWPLPRSLVCGSPLMFAAIRDGMRLPATYRSCPGASPEKSVLASTGTCLALSSPAALCV